MDPLLMLAPSSGCDMSAISKPVCNLHPCLPAGGEGSRHAPCMHGLHRCNRSSQPGAEGPRITTLRSAARHFSNIKCIIDQADPPG